MKPAAIVLLAFSLPALAAEKQKTHAPSTRPPRLLIWPPSPASATKASTTRTLWNTRAASSTVLAPGPAKQCNCEVEGPAAAFGWSSASALYSGPNHEQL